MPNTKRYHRKSRNGCVRCKQRRVKCDEARPTCMTCRRKGLVCLYDEATAISISGFDTPSAPIPAAESRNNPPLTASAAFPYTPNSDVSPPTTLGENVEDGPNLARVYLEQVAPTFSRSSSRPSQSWIWHIFVPSQALFSETIRHGMLTAAAIFLHLNAVDQGHVTDTPYLATAMTHGNTFVQQSTAEIQALEPSNTNANLASARLLCVLSLAFFRQRRRGGLHEGTAWNWVHLLRGVSTLHESLARSAHTIHPMVMEDMIPEAPSSIETPDGVGHSPSDVTSSLWHYVKKTRRARFATLRLACNEGWLGAPDDSEPDAFATTIDHLSEVTDLACTTTCSSLFRVIFSWAASLSPAMVQNLTEGHPGMLAIYTHWLMLVVLIEDLWWIGDMGRSGIQDAIPILEDNSDLMPVMSWPKEMLRFK